MKVSKQWQNCSFFSQRKLSCEFLQHSYQCLYMYYVDYCILYCSYLPHKLLKDYCACIKYTHIHNTHHSIDSRACSPHTSATEHTNTALKSKPLYRWSTRMQKVSVCVCVQWSNATHAGEACTCCERVTYSSLVTAVAWTDPPDDWSAYDSECRKTPAPPTQGNSGN